MTEAHFGSPIAGCPHVTGNVTLSSYFGEKLACDVPPLPLGSQPEFVDMYVNVSWDVTADIRCAFVMV